MLARKRPWERFQSQTSGFGTFRGEESILGRSGGPGGDPPHFGFSILDFGLAAKPWGRAPAASDLSDPSDLSDLSDPADNAAARPPRPAYRFR